MNEIEIDDLPALIDLIDIRNNNIYNYKGYYDKSGYAVCSDSSFHIVKIKYEYLKVIK
jgi:hypothetical protein